jgi:hypothetical protein
VGRLTLAAMMASLSFLPMHAQAYYSGNDLLQDCQDTPVSYADGFCEGFISGVNGTIAALQSNQHSVQLVCFPPHTVNKQVIDVVIRYLKNHPESRSYTASSEAMVAIK